MGRTAASLRETSIGLSASGLFKNFEPGNVQKHNILIPTQDSARFADLTFDLDDPDAKFIVGYYRFSTIFSTKLVTDYFCFEIGDYETAFRAARAAEANASFLAAKKAAEKATKSRKPDDPEPPTPRRRLPKTLARTSTVPTVYRTDLDWPPDED